MDDNKTDLSLTPASDREIVLGTDGVTRLVPSYGELLKMVVDTIDYNATNNVDFTAYDVTRKLRRDNPTIEIDHARVRVMVHTLAPSAGFVPHTESYPGGDALLYTLGGQTWAIHVPGVGMLVVEEFAAEAVDPPIDGGILGPPPDVRLLAPGIPELGPDD